MMAADTPQAAFANQVSYCRANDAPITAAVVGALAAALDRSTETGRHVLDWQGPALADALPLRDGIQRRSGRADGPLAWLSLEADRSLLGHALTARYWPGGEDPRLLATAHAYGAWMEWRG